MKRGAGQDRRTKQLRVGVGVIKGPFDGFASPPSPKIFCTPTVGKTKRVYICVGGVFQNREQGLREFWKLRGGGGGGGVYADIDLSYR